MKRVYELLNCSVTYFPGELENAETPCPDCGRLHKWVDLLKMHSLDLDDLVVCDCNIPILKTVTFLNGQSFQMFAGYK